MQTINNTTELNTNELTDRNTPRESDETQTTQTERIQPSDDIETVHSANMSDDHFIHFSDRPINYYRNQLIFKIANIDVIISEEIFPGFKRIIMSQKTFEETDITEFLKKHHNGKQSAIMAPESLYDKIQTSFRRNFCQSGHFIFVTKIVEDITNEERQSRIIIKEHERAHRGTNEIESQIRRAYFFPRMGNKIRTHINACNICNPHKYDCNPYNIKISPRPITEKPLERVHIDIFIINRNNFLSIIDSFSKHLQMIPMETKNIIDVTNALNKYFTLFGIPNNIISDQETTFQSTQMKEFLNNLNIRLEYASSSESNGQIEKTHATIIEIFNTNKHKMLNPNTSTTIELAVALYNNTVHSATGFTPNEVIFNQNNFIDPREIQERAKDIFKTVNSNLEKARAKIIKLNDKKEEPPDLTDEQIVYFKPNVRSKAQPRGIEMKVHNSRDKTFHTNRNIKRNKNKIKRLQQINKK